ncbi:type 1 glutamine amidotransferase [Corynebacterium hansenii]|uniref:Lipid II isoglutaminyl synthase (glutamine-hydrolyzing) subunit GatD n=1 Tax=Corynebacterium hansenii TaxID=394964 RepID=A0ABV7ZQB3_9CORY|nr:glutamine amidotransferase [Corynebacterium hansenii]WJY98824.1 cobyric acid synthase [Corynebacterium hansenii]
MTDLNIGLILPDVLGTYGDDGNALVLRERARRRGFDAEVTPVKLGQPVPEGLDIYTIGGGEDVAQTIAAEHLAKDGGLVRAAAAGRPILAICAGFQVLGESFRAGGREVAGLGLLDCTTTSLETRAIGEIRTAPLSDELSSTLTGFENHMGRTTLGADARPLGRVIRGVGNAGPERQPEPGRAPGPVRAGGSGGADVVKPEVAETPTGGEEGAVQGSIVATYLHGPVLARNPELADLLLARAMGISVSELEPLELPVIGRLRAERIASKPRPKSER